MADTFVLDACAVLRFVQDEPGADVVEDYLRRAQRGELRLLLHVINLGEVVYRTARVHGPERALRVRDELGLLPLAVAPFEDGLFWKAVELKGQHAMSYADCFAAALAMTADATLLTSDPEFEVLEDRVRRVRV